ncbi:MAG: 5,6-dimethylbenzimidazole synthase [Hyphomicrobiaceae bacterium]
MPLMDATLNRMAEEDRLGLYRTVFSRRDVRSQFVDQPIPDDVLGRVLTAAHHAPSVGLMQPWNFILLRSPDKRAAVQALFAQANAEAAELHDGERGTLYRSLKLEGILESPLNICVTCNHERTGSPVLGRSHIRETDVYSTVCAVQNLWLAARTEGLGVGWVSILEPSALAETLKLPDHVTPIAYLCIGYVSEFLCEPELQKAGWEKRLPLSDVVMFEEWNGAEKNSALFDQLQGMQSSFPFECLVQKSSGDGDA